MNKLLFVLMSLLLASACASNPGIVEISTNTYIISRVDKAGIFGNAAKMGYPEFLVDKMPKM